MQGVPCCGFSTTEVVSLCHVAESGTRQLSKAIVLRRVDGFLDQWTGSKEHKNKIMCLVWSKWPKRGTVPRSEREKTRANKRDVVNSKNEKKGMMGMNQSKK